jgi:transcription elongation factor
VNSHKRNRKTLQHHMQLVELLEVPQLVDACARNGFHEEALELANFVNGLERRHLLAAEVRSIDGKARGGSGVVQSIVDDVHTTLLSLRTSILAQRTANPCYPTET